jgi:integrase
MFALIRHSLVGFHVGLAELQRQNMGGKLTAADVEQAGQGMHFDGDGLYLQVSGPESKSWIYRYTLKGKARWHGLGSARDVSLPNARKKRDKARVQVRDGMDLVAERKRVKVAQRLGGGITFRQAAENYITAQQNSDAAWSNEKHASQWSNTLKTYAYPIIGDLSVEAIERAHVIRVLDPIWTTKPETARRLRGRVESILDRAIARGERTNATNPASRGPLLKGLPKQAKNKGHHAALPYAEVGAFMRDLQSREGIAALALEFTILTAARTGEVLGAKWTEIDTMARVWTVPASRMKGRREHRVPLSAPTLAVLERVRTAGQGSEHVFPNISRGRPLSNMAMLKALERLGRPELTAHGFRSTFRDWAAERTNFPGEVAEAALAHVVDDKTEAAYRRGDLFDKRRRLMDAWADYCVKAPVTGAVVSFEAVRR